MTVVSLRTLGVCSLCVDGEYVEELARSRQLTSLLVYLLVNPGRELPNKELVEVLWPEREPDAKTEHALKNLMYRARAMLRRSGADGLADALASQKGGYCFVEREVDFSSDIRRFTELCHHLERQEVYVEEGYALFSELIGLYRGRFLQELSPVEWIRNYQQKLHDMYLRACRQIVDYLIRWSYYQEIPTLCSRVLEIDPNSTTFQRLHIWSLLQVGDWKQARAVSERTIAKIKSRGLPVPEELQKMQRQVLSWPKRVEKRVHMLANMMAEPRGHEGAYQCEYASFCQISQVLQRILQRHQLHCCLGVFTVERADGGALAEHHCRAAMTDLLTVLQLGLRRGDVFCRYSDCQFLVLLTVQLHRHGAQAMRRMVEQFGELCRVPGIALDFDVMPLPDPDIRD